MLVALDVSLFPRPAAEKHRSLLMGWQCPYCRLFRLGKIIRPYLLHLKRGVDVFNINPDFSIPGKYKQVKPATMREMEPQG